MHLKLKRRTKMTKTKLSILPILAVLVMTPSADAKQQNTQAPCSTRVECDAMAEDLQGKIDVLEVKGLENLTDDEFENLDKLQDKFIAVSKVRTAQQKKIIAHKDAEIAEENAKQAELSKSQDKKLDEIRALLKK